MPLVQTTICALLSCCLAALPAAATAQTAAGAAAAAVPAAAAPAPPASPQQAALYEQRDVLATAIVKRDAARVSQLIRSGMELNFNFDDGNRGRSFESPLTLAIHRDHVDIATLLIQGGADVNRRDGSGRTALQGARSPAGLRLLVQSGADPNQPDRSGRTPLIDAVERGDLRQIDALLAIGAKPPATGADLLALAVERRHPELIAPLLERGVDPRSPATRALRLLIESGDNERALLLIQRGADVTARDERETLLMRALFRQRWEVAEAMIDAGAPVKLANAPGCTYQTCQGLQLARLASLHPPTLAKLKAKGLDLNAASADGHTALTSLMSEQTFAVRAVAAGARVAVAQNAGTGATVSTISQPPAPVREIPAPDNEARAMALLDAGADPNARFRDATPLMLAITLKKSPAVEEALLRRGARIEYETTFAKYDPAEAPPPSIGNLSSAAGSRYAASVAGELTGMTAGPLTWTVLQRRPDVGQKLLQRDRKVDRSDRYLLYFAADAGAWDLLLAALPYLRDVEAGNRADVTPLILAAAEGRADVVRALLGAGAKVNARTARSWPPLLEMNLAAAFAGHSPSPPRLVGGYTALRAAREKQHTEAVKVLAAAGGRE